MNKQKEFICERKNLDKDENYQLRRKKCHKKKLKLTDMVVGNH
jgi:hypothetical protein